MKSNYYLPLYFPKKGLARFSPRPTPCFWPLLQMNFKTLLQFKQEWECAVIINTQHLQQFFFF